MEQAIKRLNLVANVQYQITSRRHLRIEGKSTDPEILERVKNIVRRSHGYVEEEKKL